MLTKQTVGWINGTIQDHKDKITGIAGHIWKHPETGFREWNTAAYLADFYTGLGYRPVLMGNIPGFYVDVDTGRPGPALALIGELDSVICVGHPEADKTTGAVHACGHHTQCAGLAGAAMALRDPRLLSALSGRIRLVAVPAEELIELGFRASLREQGIIRYFGGKVEFLYRGVFDGMDAAVMIHSGNVIDKALSVYKGNNGCLAKNITYTGKAAHAGGGPHKAINALYAASLGLQAINAIRETFTEENITRVHPIITEGGTAVNVIPEAVKLESYVRGASVEAIVNENKKVNRALAGAALSIGARVRVSDVPGYMPLHNEAGLNAVSAEVGAVLLGEERVDVSENWGAGSTDMGDLSCVMPVTQPGGGGGSGTGHGEDYRVADEDTACLDGAKYLTGMACALLADGGAELLKIKEAFKPMFESRAKYFEFADELYRDRELVSYSENTDAPGAAVVW